MSHTSQHLAASLERRAARSAHRPRGNAPLHRALTRSCALVLVLSGCSGQVNSPFAPGASAATDAPDGPGAGAPGNDGKSGPTGIATALNCEDKQVHVGSTPLQRLSRAQYAHSLRDLLQVDFDRSLLSEDEKVGIFAGNTVATVTDLSVEQYIAAAERVAKQAQPRLEALAACDRAKSGDATCAAQFIEKFGKRVYRRPLSAEERSSYEALFNEFKGAGYTDGLRVVVQTMLQSPNFLYRVELQPVTAGNGEAVPLDAFELASRLSFFLLSTTPDDALLAAAASGALLEQKGLDEQVARLIEDPRFSDTLESFHMQWLAIDDVEDMSKDATLFPAFNLDLAKAMRKETLSFVNYVFGEDDASLDTLLSASYSFPEGPLLGVYGLPTDAPKTASGAPVELDPKQRAGILTQPAFLAVHSHYNQSSPVDRGKIVIRNVLCQNLPDPPADVNTTPAGPGASTTREQLIEHQSNPSCAGCHKRIDGIGFGLEQFDALGAFRAMEAGKPVDSSGEIVGTKSSNGAFPDAVGLAHKLAGSAEVQQCVTKQWLRFALGRLDAEADACTLADLFEQFESSGHDLRALLQSIVKSDAFRSKRVAPVSAP